MIYFKDVRSIRTYTRSIRVDDRMSEYLSGVSGHIPGVSGWMIECPNICPKYPDIYPEYPGLGVYSSCKKKLKLSNGFKKITKILTETIHHVYCLYKKFWSENLIRSSLWLKILSNPSHVYGISSEMLSFVSNVRDNFYETCSIFYHSLHVWYHDILTNLIIFRLRLIFIEFKNNAAARSWSCFVKKMFDFSFQFLDKASHWTQ